MSRTVVAIVSGAVGIVVGLYIADKYAQWKVQSGTNDVLNTLHAGFLAPFVDPLTAGLVG
jgi:hypothetical protein